MAVPFFRCALLLSLVTRAALAQTCKAKAAGQKSVYIPGGKGVGCNAGGVKDCCYCVYDMAACENAFGSGPCQATSEARSKEGFDGCNKTGTTSALAPAFASAKKCSDLKAAGQRALNIPGGKGVGCHAEGVKDCCYCVYNMTKCEKAFGKACHTTNEARRKEGFDGCDPIETAAEPAPTFASAKQCSDVEAAGQRALNIPGGEGVGCDAGGVKDCCFCVYDMAACEKAYGKVCQVINEGRHKQGFDGCDPIETAAEPAPTFASAKQCSDVKAAGQRALNIPGGKGVGCRAGGLKDCCYCVYNMTKCEKAFGQGPCQATNEARKKQGFDGCDPETAPEPAPTVASAKQCSDVKAAGQRALNIPGGKGVGCRAGGLKDCCYCVDDMAACEKAFGKACQATNEARRKEGFDGCNPMSEIIV